jgi:hypothetical protein
MRLPESLQPTVCRHFEFVVPKGFRSMKYLRFLSLLLLTPLPLAAQTTITPEQIGTTFYADGFPASCTVGSASYTTQADCAWATASAFVTTAAGQYGALLVFSSNYYQKKVEWVQPTTTNGQAISLKGAGMDSTYIIQVASTPTLPMISSPNQSGNLATFDISDLTLSANSNADSCADLVDIISNNIRSVNCTGVIDGSDHDWQIGFPGRNAQEVVMDHVFASGASDAKTRAQVTVSVSGGIPSFTVTNGGAGYPTTNTDIGVFLTGTGHGDHPCSSIGTSTATVNTSGVITALSSTATGCVAPMYVQVYPVSKIAAGFRLYMSDSTGYDLYPQGVQLGIDLEFGNTTLIHPHPTNVPIGIRVTQNDDLDKVECDTIGEWCIDFEGTTPVTVEHTNGYTGLASSIPGYATFHFGSGAGPAQIVGLSNLCQAGLPAGYNEILTAAGPYPANALPSGTDVIGNDAACGTPLGDIITQPITMGNLSIIGSTISSPYGTTITNGLVIPPGQSSYNNGYAEMGLTNQVIVTPDGMTQMAVGSAVASASTIAPISPTTHITGTTAVSTITRPTGCGLSTGYSCTITLISDGGFSLATGGNIAAAETTTAGHSYRLTYDQATSRWYPQ